MGKIIMPDTSLARAYEEGRIVRLGEAIAEAHAHGQYYAWNVRADGTIDWEDAIENTVTTVGKNLALDTFLAGSNYSVTGPFMGLISSVSYGAGPAIGDTMASHAGWLEAGVANAPTYTIPRKTCAWSAAGSGSKALSAALAFAITGAGTVKGCFIVFGTGAVSTIADTNGTLYSAGTFSGGDKTVANTDTLNCSYTASM
jgi:hypothetical protein